MDLTSKLAILGIVLGLFYGLCVWKRHWITLMYRFLTEAKVELKKVTWPGRKEVNYTTIVVIVAVFIFGIFLSTVDFVVTFLRTELFKAIGL